MCRIDFHFSDRAGTAQRDNPPVITGAPGGGVSSSRRPYEVRAQASACLRLNRNADDWLSPRALSAFSICFRIRPGLEDLELKIRIRIKLDHFLLEVDGEIDQERARASRSPHLKRVPERPRHEKARSRK